MSDHWVGAEITDFSSCASEIDTHVELLKQDELFNRSRKLCRLLDYLWAELLAGRASKLKAYSIALDVFDKDETFDAQKNTIVRVQMGKLRKRLAHYYAKSDCDFKMEIPNRSYVLKIYKRSGDRNRDLRSDLTTFMPIIRLSSFKAIGESRDVRTIAEGLESDLLTVLSKFSRVQLSRADSGNSDKQIIYILSGSVRQSGNRFRVSAELESLQNAYIVWSDQYDLSAEELIGFDAIEKLAVKISVAVADTYGFVANRIISKGSSASNLSMNSYAYMRNHDLELHSQLISDIKKLVNSDIANAQIWSLWSLLNLDGYRFGFNEDKLENPLSTAVRAARHATSLDPHNSFAHRCLALAHFYCKEFRQFRTFGMRAIELNPYSTDNRADYGRHLWFAGEFSEGLTHVNVALEQSVDPPNWYHHISALEAIRTRNFEDARFFKDELKGYQTIGDFFLAACIAGHLNEKIEGHDIRTAQKFLPQNALAAFDAAIERWHVPLNVLSLVREGLEKAGLTS
ncbi:MAG: hypothetical protein HKN36_08780 [Hellea sp.]|nr:hypothetical protein [Hellea sp.]